MKRTFLKFAAAAAVLAVVSACGGSDDDDNDTPAQLGNVVAVASANPDFSSLVAAVTKAELVTALSDSAATLTVFAPTNAAFTALAVQLGFADAAAMVTALTKEQLTTVLTYHVLATKVASTAIPFGTPVATLNTADTITITAGTPPVIATIADTTTTPATITAVDVQASNGVIHVIDKVLIPSGLLPPPG